MEEALKTHLVIDIKEIVNNLESFEGFLDSNHVYFFNNPKGPYKLKDAKRDIYFNTIRRITSLEPYKSKISLQFITRAFEAIITKCIVNGITDKVISNALNEFELECKSSIKDWIVFVPIDGLDLDRVCLLPGRHKVTLVNDLIFKELTGEFEAMIDAQSWKEELKELKKKELHEHFKRSIRNRVCLLYYTKKEDAKALEIAQSDGEQIIHILTIIAVINNEGRNKYRITFSGKHLGALQTYPMISVDRTHSKYTTEHIGTRKNLKINHENYGRFLNLGIEKLFRIYMKRKGERTHLERMLLNSTRLFYYGYMSLDPNSEFISYVSIIENFLSPSDNVQLSESISDGLALFLKSDYYDRYYLKRYFKDLYNIRSKIVHGGNATPNYYDLINMRYFAKEIIKIIMSNLDRWEDKDDILDYIECMKLS